MTRGLPLAELRRRYAAPGARVGAALIEALRDDGRAGARALADELVARRRRARRETRRLGRLFQLERELREAGAARLAGVDEVGMGPLAGPVYAAAVVLADDFRPRGLDDSKRLSAPERERLAREIHAHARAVSVARVGPREIDRLNIYQAGLLAMRRAVQALPLSPDLVLVDGREIPSLAPPQRRVVGGDASVGSIAAASVVAKVARDREMRALGARYPGYGFEHHVGYGTAEHLAQLRRRGPTPAHRRSFEPVRRWRSLPGPGG